MRSVLGWPAAVVLALTFAGGTRAADPNAALAKNAAAVFDAVRAETLPNGLRVYLLPVPGAETVTTMVAYKVGAGDEEKDQTGLSHYLEHLLFKGTDKLLPGDIDRATQRNGGRNNAYTSEDMTVYHFDFAADRWEQALTIEADRMRNVRIDAKHEFEQEKGAVVAELKQGEDRPWDLEHKAILPLLYPKAAPYSHPVIGEEAHVRSATAEVIKRHYDKWYHPNNAALIVVGGFDPDAALAKIRSLFGPIPKADLPARKPEAAAPARPAKVRKEMPSKFDVPRMVAGFNTVTSGAADDPALDLAATLLTGGRTGRLYKKLVETDRLASAVSASNATGRYAGWFGVNVELLKGKDRASAEAAVFAELKRLADGPVTAAELNRAKRSALADAVFGRESVHGLADAIAAAVTVHDLDYLKTYHARLMAVTAGDIQRVATKYLAEPRAVVVWSLPEEAGAGGKADGPPAKPRRSADKSGGSVGAVKLTDAKRTVLPNGLTLITLESHRLPVVTASAYVRDVTLREPAAQSGIAALVGDMLEEGTATRTGDEIAVAIEDVGGSLTFSQSGAALKVLAPDAGLGLGLLLDSLQHPSFPVEAFERKREQQLSAIADAETQPQNRADAAFRALVYGDHPYGRPALGKKEVVAKLTPADARAFHAKAFGPDSAILVVVGDFATPDMVALVTKLTADWKPIRATAPVPATPPGRAEPVTKIIPDPTAAQTHVYVGHLGVKRSDPDYYTLLVMDNVLGTGPGFTDRLSATLRDRQGLAYTVSAQITGGAGDQPGAFTGYIGTFADKYTWVRDGFLAEIRRIRDEPATAAEVEDAKKYLLGGLPFRLTTGGAVAGQLLAAERFGLGFDFLEKSKAAVAAVTPAMVQAAAKKHLDPAKLVIVAVGPIDPAGRPLAGPPKK